MKINISRKYLGVYLLFLLFIFQSPLESVFSGFSYIDESIIVISLCLIIHYIGLCKRKLTDRKCVVYMVCLNIYLIVGLSANYIYKYQQLHYIVLDVVANVKFFFAIIAGYLILTKNSWDKIKEGMRTILIVISYLLFFLVLIDKILGIWSGEIRYGIKSEQLFFAHSTYLAAAVAFIIVYLTAIYNKKNLIPIFLDLIVMVLTLRSKAIVSALVYVFLFWILIKKKNKLKLWQLVVVGIVGVYIAWGQINYYFVELKGSSARSVLIITSIKILKDYFPLGTGFGTFASHSAAINYSPVYNLYGFSNYYELSASNPNAFLDDMFWPIIIGQTGIIGSLSYIVVIISIIKKCLAIGKEYKYYYLSAIFVMLYLIISSVAEPSFNNSIAVPLGVILGMIFREVEREKAYD